METTASKFKLKHNEHFEPAVNEIVWVIRNDQREIWPVKVVCESDSNGKNYQKRYLCKSFNGEQQRVYSCNSLRNFKLILPFFMEFYPSDFVCGAETSNKTLDDIYGSIRKALSNLPQKEFPLEWKHFKVFDLLFSSLRARQEINSR